eukprot:XP_011669087.1 PREDICTED: protein downstream neighbor of son homolog isoform X1 [Strongylocentrotus purpuratus]
MSSMENSPSKQWTKPSHIMKVRLKRNRRSTSDLTSKSFTSTQSQVNSGSQSTGNGRSGKRRNPFGSGGGDNVMRRRIQSEVVGGERQHVKKENGSNHRKLFTALDSQQDEVFDVEACQRLTKAMKAMEAEEEEKTASTSTKEQTEQVSSKPLARGKPDLTPDWCLRTRLRFTSHSSFSWCQPIRMKEEAKGLCSFVQGQHGPDTEEQETVEETSWRSDLQQATMCWMHPDIPWLNLFPRVVPEPKKFKQSIATKDTTIASALMTNWSESFRSVFHLLRSGHCPYFYLCTHHFTVLFRAAGIAATPTMHALMTPTTRGLREALKTEGISYTMPLHQEAPSPVETETTTATAGQQQKATEESCPEGEIEEQSEVNQEDDQIKKEIAEEEEEVEDILRSPTKASSWLQSMGLDKTNFPSLEPTRVKFQTDQLLKLDNRPQSLVLVEGLDTAALYNFLLNSRTVLTSVGPLADIPPTILSPIAFKGATLNSCKLKSGTLKQQSSKSSLVEVSSLEVTGPIMPHNVHSLCALLRRTQEGAFHMALSNHEATAPFTSCTYSTNEKSGVRDAGDEERLKAMRTNCGLAKRQVEYLGSKCTVNLPTKEVTCTDRLFL